MVVDGVLARVIALDDSKNYSEMLDWVKASGLGPDQQQTLFWKVFETQRMAASYTVVVAVIEMGGDSPAMRMVEFVGSLMFSNGRRCASALAELRRQLPPESTARDQLRNAMEPMVAFATMNLFKADRLDDVLSLLDAWKLVSPGMDAAFGSASCRRRTPVRPIEFCGPRSPGMARRAVVAARKYLYFIRPGSREHDIGPRLVTAMRAYGWTTDFVPMRTMTPGRELDEEYRKIADLCRARSADVLVLDEFFADGSTRNCVEVVKALKRDMPALKVVVAYYDPWALSAEAIIRAAGLVDCIWNLFPASPLYRDAALAAKVFEGPYPMGGAVGAPDVPLTGGIEFIGAIQLYNWHRAFWIAAARRDGLPIETRLSTHADDGLDVMESYRAYMRRLELAGCCLNFSMRLNETRILTGRAFETIHAGALLVQEETDDISFYFTAGEHYLSFANYAELREIASFIARNPAEAESIRRRGFQFARDRYSDDKIMGYLDKHLFG
ncbi:hypothetical protein A6A04_11665 [Paramagnetospirillum marisnigri]|uniref:Spore protein YkvP/CgeB glycosyl transferase-like domain-containing protein n=1 Tax=Paramagnetospirillum marisnigri TaxID=1285242 RepID=A0A178MWE5_9PROT|nr:glycosyltransferase [Paramagnetospirillum marisnigri]OAN54578.1 hypothetical protein A6A04_11665 [Paramagnetospirillum marisnigri]